MIAARALIGITLLCLIGCAPMTVASPTPPVETTRWVVSTPTPTFVPSTHTPVPPIPTFVPPTSTPTLVPSTSTPTSTTPTPRRVVPTGYLGYTVVAGDTLAGIAAAAGSTPELIAAYNRLPGEPSPGRALILPRVADMPSTLSSERLLISSGAATQPWIALTLDAGGKATAVEQVLQTLRERNVRITFFLTGAFIRDNPDLVRQMAADGHELANHTFNHPDLRSKDTEAIREELRRTDDLLFETTGLRTRPFFRPPYGAYDNQVLDTVIAEGYLPVYWTLDSRDSVGDPKTPTFLLERVTATLPPEQLPGAIILAHCGIQSTADALPMILDRFATMGFEVRTLSEVLGNASMAP